MYEIKTSNYIKSSKILVDGKEWTMTPPGAGDELALNQAKRRAELLEKKVQNGTATEEDYDTYDKLENRMYSVFQKIFSDGTPDNSAVTAWLDSLPMVVIMAILEDIQKQATDKKEASNATDATEAEVS
jgi:hypothetical protein